MHALYNARSFLSQIFGIWSKNSSIRLVSAMERNKRKVTHKKSKLFSSLFTPNRLLSRMQLWYCFSSFSQLDFTGKDHASHFNDGGFQKMFSPLWEDCQLQKLNNVYKQRKRSLTLFILSKTRRIVSFFSSGRSNQSLGWETHGTSDQWIIAYVKDIMNIVLNDCLR